MLSMLLAGLSIFPQENLQGRLERYRAMAIKTVEAHMKEDPNCAFKDAAKKLRSVRVVAAYPDYREERVAAWPSPDGKTIFFNSKMSWNDPNWAIVVFLHEYLHANKICGNDRKPLSRVDHPLGVCSPFGVPLYSTGDITVAVMDHLGLKPMLAEGR